MDLTSVFRQCIIDGCEKPQLRREMCSLHYHRWRRHGNPLDTTLPGQRRTTRQQRFWAKVDLGPGLGPAGDCWEWTAFKNESGYGRFYGGQSNLATHYAWFDAYGVFPTQMMLHSCDNPACVNVRHLREGTTQDNMDDMRKRNRSTRGERSGRAKLTYDAVREIKAMRAQGIGQRAVGRHFGVDHKTIRAIEIGYTWKEAV